ncbi:Asp-tRNA(Asn)/Glu-tRNA(Gln) amidotransferase subunit GatA [Candidatus Berkiella aquae]|uniref:Glutamyl-tRNA(Gln) amidotransferase subunit A n=1 Tax=Candidatus Berkiella aquae TaxID=295108 RepID=A0A0Q9YJF1_9GAMM|nr:Asp-tRNA(Asn)/Glu-tRNA(Gln) amidotransferase subunit GatA [Candidatus Berkiella aquae]MCS5710707.1 Asp-tRNA(Asn)/Glu-tRNA(Gln) amidotransferase subunit GatA [Candidatus Berkiella aquae]
MHNLSIAKLSEELSKKSFSSVELTQHFLKRIAEFDKTLNSFITVTEETALAQAKAADAARAAGNAGRLTGIPIAQKDIFCTQGIKTSCGSKMLDNFIAPYDATVVSKMSTSGLVMLGKTNMDEFAMGSSNENSFYGPVRNPWDLETVPGGSSGGSAAAVAARLTPGSTGTDTGGSIRQPAALCGISGLKPTYGRVSRYGMIAFASSLDQGGPFAQTAEDLALLLNSMAGFDERDSTCVNVPVPDYTALLNESLQGKKIGLPKEYFEQGLDKDVEARVQDAIKVFEKLGAKIVPVSLPTSPLAIAVYYVVASAECSSNLSRFDGVRYGYRCKNPRDLEDLYKRSRGEAFGDEVKRRIMVGTYALSSGYYDAYYLKAQKVRKLISNDFKRAFAEADFLLGPTSPTPAFKIGEKMADPVSMYLSDIYTIATNLAGLPGLSIPCGFVNNLPVGIQLMGKQFDESTLLNAAHLYQQETDWHQSAPKQFA